MTSEQVARTISPSIISPGATPLPTLSRKGRGSLSSVLTSLLFVASEEELRRAQHRIDDQAREQNEAGVAIGFEDAQAERGIAGVEPADLPGEMQRERR